ncbi:biogenesis AIM24 [Paenibacillus sophorae]|uniref:AIM24 family protein n=1 Tax=Paenibacillus sophorae TaxID=1333845 RepID=A0A1H8TAY6_9BACL|nr:AIM24 family protein [Paenibacillus sophorae]QWU17159.1 AIM24 family protein [Paenibacillus sophorae]SEO87668.1 biogenesis AIM24 [Paenibacillus sophorae]
MNAEVQDGGNALSGEALTFTLEENEEVHVLHPQQIIAYQGPSSGRADRFMDVKGMYRKRKLIRADMTGPCRFTAALPPGYRVKTVMLDGKDDLLYDFKHLFYYSKGITMQTRVLSVKNMIVTRDVVKVRFSGSGSIGILTEGTVCEAALDPVQPLYVDAGSVIAYPENARLELTVYGNHLASQHMNYHWKMTGSGPVLFQAGRQNRRFERENDEDGLFKRFLREILPFGGVFIK